MFLLKAVVFFVKYTIKCFVMFPVALHFLTACRLDTGVARRISLSSCVSGFLVLVFIVKVIFRVPLIS